MAALPNIEEGQSTSYTPYFNRQYYVWCKTYIQDFIMEEASELWDIIYDGPYLPMKEKTLELKATKEDSREKDEDMTYLIQRIQKVVDYSKER